MDSLYAKDCSKEILIAPKSPLLILYQSLKVQESSCPDTSVHKKIGRIVEQMVLSQKYCNPRTFRSTIIASQLTLIEYRLWKRIVPEELLTHKQQATSSFTNSSNFFNYMTRFIENSILEPSTGEERAVIIHCWISVAEALQLMNNYQSLKAVLSALGTPPITRLKLTWSYVDALDMATLAEMVEVMSEDSNYNKYRACLQEIDKEKPVIPYIGLFFHDLAYLKANGKSATDPKILELISDLHRYQLSPAYSQSEAMKPSTRNSAIYDMKRLSVVRKTPIRESQSREVYNYFKLASEHDIAVFVTHWLLSGMTLTEKQIDALSLLREPKSPSVMLSLDDNSSHHDLFDDRKSYIEANLIDLSYLPEKSDTSSLESDSITQIIRNVISTTIGFSPRTYQIDFDNPSESQVVIKNRRLTVKLPFASSSTKKSKTTKTSVIDVFDQKE